MAFSRLKLVLVAAVCAFVVHMMAYTWTIGESWISAGKESSESPKTRAFNHISTEQSKWSNRGDIFRSLKNQTHSSKADMSDLSGHEEMSLDARMDTKETGNFDTNWPLKQTKKRDNSKSLSDSIPHPAYHDTRDHLDDTAIEMRQANYSSNCTEKRHIFFVKTHKTGGTTLCNILSRFGMRRNLRFWLPRTETENPVPHSIEIVVHHTEYDQTQQDDVMVPGTRYITILREPFSQFISSVVYYRDVIDLGHVPGYNTETKIKNVLTKHPKTYGKYIYVQNFMARDLGFISRHGNSSKLTQRHLEHIDSRFSIVLILEHFVESLVLLRRKLCWTLQDILFRKALPEADSALKNKTRINMSRIDDSYGQLHRQFSPLDYLVYEHFSREILEDGKFRG